MKWTIHAFTLSSEAGLHLKTLNGWKAKLAWAPQRYCEQSAQDRYVVNIAVFSCSKSDASLGNWAHAASPQLLPWSLLPSVELIISWVVARDVNHYSTESFLHASLGRWVYTSRLAHNCYPKVQWSGVDVIRWQNTAFVLACDNMYCSLKTPSTSSCKQRHVLYQRSTVVMAILTFLTSTNELCHQTREFKTKS